MVCPRGAARAALVGGQRRRGWARSGPPIASLGHTTAVAQQGGVEGGFGGVRARASSPPSMPWRSILSGSPGCFGAVSGGSAPDAGLPEPEEGTSGHFHTSSTGRALLFAQDRR